MRQHTTIAAVAACLLALTACGSSGDTARTTPQGAAPDPTVTPETETPEPAGGGPGDKAVGLADTVTYDNDVAVSLSGFTRAVSGSDAYPENVPYIRFNIKITNGSGRTMDLSALDATCSYGDKSREGGPVFDSGKGLTGLPESHLRPGRSASAATGCVFPKEEKYLQVEVTPDWETETAIFAGTVKK